MTGADGFVGSWLVPRLLEDGHQVVAGMRPGPAAAAERLGEGVRRVALELTDPGSVERALDPPPDAVVHLAAVASGADARRDPLAAWVVNAAGTACLAEALGRLVSAAEADPVLLVVSTAEVYGRGDRRPRVETDPAEPVSPYAASKLGGEIAALELHRRTGLKVVVARAFAHTGRGQDERFVVPALARRLILAKRIAAPVIKVGNLEPVREFLHVSDVVDAYARLLVQGQPGEVYNVAGGQAISLRELLERLMRIVGYRVIPEVDPELVRPVDIPYLVGDGSKLRSATGWSPRVALDQVLAEVVDAQAY